MSFFTSTNSFSQRPPSRAQRNAPTRPSVHKLAPIVVVNDDLVSQRLEDARLLTSNHEGINPALVLVDLKTELSKIGDDALRRGSAFRKAFESIVMSSRGVTRELLQLIFFEYEELLGKSSLKPYAALLERKEVTDRFNRKLIDEVASLKRKIAEIELHTLNLERKLKLRTDQLLEISSQHNIPLHLADENSHSSKTRSLSDIRSYQEKLMLKMTGGESRESMSKERLELMERRLAQECTIAEKGLTDLSALGGTVIRKETVPQEHTEDRVLTAEHQHKLSPDKIFDMVDHPLLGGGLVCVDLTENIDLDS